MYGKDHPLYSVAPLIGLTIDDQEFCKYPITSDFTVNPYRYRQETTRGSQHLLHAIVALSCHFRQRSAIQLLPSADAIDHKNTAVVLYQGALSRNDIHLHGLSMLDTSMALWQMEVCELLSMFLTRTAERVR